MHVPNPEVLTDTVALERNFAPPSSAICVLRSPPDFDGADAARFLRWIAETLEHPLALALDG